MWWEDAVVYQIYPRSFQDTNGDGIGDLRGIVQRLPHIRELGADAIWLSPIYPSPNADFGYDISGHASVDPDYGTLDDLDRLVEAAHAHGLKLLLDFVPSHVSTEHPWFHERPDFFVWADAPPNNWRAAFGGPAWRRDPERARYYLHSFFAEQADLDWRNPDVRAAQAAILHFWLARGVDGFRLDAIDRLMKDRALRDDPPATEPSPLPFVGEYGELLHLHSRNAPDIGVALAAMRDAVGDHFLVGEAYVPTAQLGPYLDTLDVTFAFEAMNAGPDAERLRTSIAAAAATGQVAWALSNHDFTRLASRFGASARAAALLFLSLPGPVFVYQGDELGTPDGPGVDPPLDRAGRDPFRHPMAWDGSATGGFTTGTPWLPALDPAARNVADQDRDPGSTLALFRSAIALRRTLSGPVEFLDSPPGTVLAQRGSHRIAINVGPDPAPLRREGELGLEARPGDGADVDMLPPGGGWITRA
jgi:alpha-glucosidase